MDEQMKTGETGDKNAVIDQKLRQFFDGKIVRKDLTKKIKEGANVPVYVLEFLLGQYCSSDDEAIIEKGVQNVKRILADNFVRPDEAQKILSQLRKKGSHTVIDIEGKERVTGVTIAEVGSDGRPIAGTEEYYSCDTLLLSCGLIPENELSRSAGVTLNPVTSGPVVNDSLETNIEGIFACGNVLHVHDLVDYVSQEASAAGKNAANYIKNGKEKDAKIVEILPVDGVRYTVPKYIRPTEMDDTLTVRFRVGAVYKNCAIATYFDDQLISKRKRPVMAPGEMEQVILDKKKLGEYPDLSKITIKIEEA